jgi:[ribosomal protein S5]-alanine N-acetyltransferase
MTTPARIVLSPFADAHVDPLLAFFRDPHVRRYLLDDSLVDREWVEGEVRASRERFEAGSLGLYAAHLREAPDALVGFVGFRPFYEPPVLQLVYGVSPAHVGRGIAGEMAKAVIDLAFGDLGFREVRASTDEPNRASVRVLERLGMTLVATEPGEHWPQLHFVLERPAPVS